MTQRLEVVARSEGDVATFAPYVASINAHGVVAFQATLRDGTTCVMTSDGGRLTGGDFYSHPAISANGELAVYARSEGREEVAVRTKDGTFSLASTLRRVGPLGPTINDEGLVALRGFDDEGAGVFVATRDATRMIAHQREHGSFEGLPVVTRDGRVAFRTARAIVFDGAVVAAIGERFATLGRFPSVNAHGDVVFVAELPDRSSALFCNDVRVLAHTAGFASFRGALINDRRTIFFYATPPNGALGVYVLRGGAPQRIVGLGDELHGSRIVDLSLNPVSVNDRDQLAIRLALANGSELVVRAET